MRLRFTLPAVALALVSGAAVLIPLPLVVISPGSAEAVSRRVRFVGRPEDQVSGQLYFLTVAVSQPTAVEAVAAWIDDDRAVLSRQRVIPKGVDEAEYVRAQRRIFAESARLAAAVGLRAAGNEVRFSGRGAQVVAVVPGSPAEGKLRTGDVIVAAGARPIELSSDLIAVTSAVEEGQMVRLTVQRGGREVDVDLAPRRAGQLERPTLGVSVATVRPDIALPFEVKVDQGEIGGPSAGFMIALTVYELADDGDLARGRRIAGTGTVDATGAIGPVGGVPQKVRAAERAGATLFLVPPDELREARAAANRRIRVEPVSTLDQAIRLLQRP